MSGSVCQSCGYRTAHPAEYHPFAFCVLVKAGQDPWEIAKDLVRDLDPFVERTRPPLVRDVQRVRHDEGH